MGSSFTLSAKKQKTSWLTKCATASRSGLRCCKRVGNRLELVGRLLGQLGARAPRAQLLRVVEDGAQTGEVHRLGEVFELEFVFRRDLVGPARLDAEDVRVAGDVQRRVFERRGVAGQLFERLVEIALLLLVFPGEIALLPDVGPAFAAAGLRRALLEGEMVADRIVLGRRRMIEQPAKVDEMLLRGRALGERDRLPFADEFLRRHWGGERTLVRRPCARQLESPVRS